MIQVQELSFKYGNHSILENININIQPNCLTALIGPNGAGKSTLFRLLCRLNNIQSGEILIDNQNILTYSRLDYAKKVAFLKQSNHLTLRVKVKEFVAFGRFPHNKHQLTKSDFDLIEEILEYMDLKTLEDEFIDSLSGGQRQRVYIAMALVQDTDYLFLDEPLNNLDIKHSVEMMELLQRLVHERKKTIVIIMHDINMALGYCDQVIALKEGRLIAAGAINEVMNSDLICELYDIYLDTVDYLGKKLFILGGEKNEQCKKINSTF